MSEKEIKKGERKKIVGRGMEVYLEVADLLSGSVNGIIHFHTYVHMYMHIQYVHRINVILIIQIAKENV